ncbi:hypothetical protein ACTXT7_006617 [Hymenolepis weldensis]
MAYRKEEVTGFHPSTNRAGMRQNYGVQLLSKDGCELLGKYQFYIAPNVNPDGYVFSHIRNRLWRKNRNKTEHENCLGVDLNRNFPYKWGKTINRFSYIRRNSFRHVTKI